MSLFHRTPDADLLGAVAVPTPCDDTGPTYSGPHYEPYDRSAEQAAHDALPALYAAGNVEYQTGSRTLEM